MEINEVRIALLILSAVVYGCHTKSDSSDNKTDKLEYELVNEWPQLSSGYRLGQPTGIGIDNNEHIFVFHRASRRWTTPFPDSLIAENTILELESETGKILNSWGANYFIMPHGLAVDKDNNIWVTDVGLHPQTLQNLRPQTEGLLTSIWSWTIFRVTSHRGALRTRCAQR